MVHGELGRNSHIKKAGTKESMLVFLGIYKKIRVSGHSMQPLLSDEDVVYIKKIQRYAVGDIVVAEHPFRKIKIVKIIEGIEDDVFILKSQNQIEGEDSGSFGPLKKENIIAKVYFTNNPSTFR